MTTVEPVDPTSRPTELYLVEWYDAILTGAPLARTTAALEASAATISAGGAEVRLELTLVAPSDDVLYGVFKSDNPELVVRACQHAGWTPDRVTANISANLTTAARLDGFSSAEADTPAPSESFQAGEVVAVTGVEDEPISCAL